MDNGIQAFLARAFARGRASGANAQIERVRSDVEGAESYEVVVADGEALSRLVERLVPRLVYHLESRKARLPDCTGVFLTVFAGEDLYFIHAKEAVAFLAEALGTTVTELGDRYSPDRPRIYLPPTR